jgi:hypothetical protein
MWGHETGKPHLQLSKPMHELFDFWGCFFRWLRPEACTHQHPRHSILKAKQGCERQVTMEAATNAETNSGKDTDREPSPSRAVIHAFACAPHGPITKSFPK